MVIEVQRSPDISAEDVSLSKESHQKCEGGEMNEHKSSELMGMQHKLSDPWKNSYNTEYQAMAEDGIMATCRTVPDISPGSIVSSLLRKANGYREGMYFSGAGNGLEQKIQELRADKEAGEVIKCTSSIHSDQDSPIDFSVKRRSSFSGSLTDDSQASLCSPGNATDYSTTSPAMDSEYANHSGDMSKRSTPSPYKYGDHHLSSQAEVEVSPSHTTSSALNGVGLFSGLPSHLLGNGSNINSFSQMTAANTFMDPRNKKNNRPFKAYPKEALQMPLGFLGLPGLTPAAIQKGVDSGIFAGMNSEDIVNLYNRQLQFLKDKQFSEPEGKTLPSSSVAPSNRNHTPQHLQQQVNQDHNSRLTNSSPTAYPPTTACTSPSLVTPDHFASHPHIASFSVPMTSGSINATLVSSTSSFAHSNSRKRPRSLPIDQKDAAYWERRRKNNDAAKRSRDARRAKEDEIALRAALLEQENIKLRVEVAALKTETARLRHLLYDS